MKILQINTTLNTGSHGRIAENIGLKAINEGHSSYYAASYFSQFSSSFTIKIGNDFDGAKHILRTRILDMHGFGSCKSTQKFISQIEEISPDIIHLHNIHGYYLNIKILFEYFSYINKPIVWTLHDCWAFTGHCSHFEAVCCSKWKKECYECPNLHGYPKSLFYDNSTRNYYQKKKLFTAVKDIIIVTPSIWLSNHLKSSFLKDYENVIINNGVDLHIFKPNKNKSELRKYNLHKRYILGVANVWSKKKGFDDFLKLREIMNPDLDIVLVGLSGKQVKSLPNGITGISRTENIKDLAALYSGAEVFVNPTYVDNFPTTNIEALSCGTPVITYNTGGSPESIDQKTGYVIMQGDIRNLKNAIDEIIFTGKEKYSDECRERAIKLYDKENRFSDYIALYNKIIQPI